MGPMLLLLLYLISLAVLVLYSAHRLILVWHYRRLVRRRLPPPQRPHRWPQVVVQLPIFNERYVVRRLLEAVAALDYPRHCLHLQILDDSTDDTTTICRHMVRELRRRGFRVDHLHRTNRVGYKAGALDAGLSKSTAPLIAIFDADFVPPPDFLKRSLPYLLEPGVGMVQARWGHINRDYSLLTRLQAIFLDAHFLIESQVRHRWGKFFNFNGTAGVWRRQAIEDAGGWAHDTLTEDLDLSYRGQLAGWQFTFLPDLVVPAELPVQMNAFKSQQHRWAKGSIQTALKILSRIWTAPLPLMVRIEATVHLTQNLVYLLMLIPAIVMMPAGMVLMQQNFLWPSAVYGIVFGGALVSVMLYYAQAVQSARGRLWPEVLLVPGLMALGIGLSLNNGLAVVAALFRRPSAFVRTPKLRIESRTDRWKSRRYRARYSISVLLELALGLYFTTGIVYFAHNGAVFSLPLLLLFQAGFLYTAFSSYWES